MAQNREINALLDYAMELVNSIMCAPLISRNKLLGAIYVENRSIANAFQEPHLDVLMFFAKQAAVLIENAMLTANLQQARKELVTTHEVEIVRLMVVGISK